MCAKNKKFQAILEPNEIHGKISLEQLAEIWNDGEVTYTEDELLKIRDWLYFITGAIYNTVKRVHVKSVEEFVKDVG